jgi:restriction system protein
MTIPDFQTLMRPILSYLADSQQKSTRIVTDAMSDEFGLTAEERAQMIPSGRPKLMNNRVGMVLDALVAGWPDRTPRTGTGKNHPNGTGSLEIPP